MPGVDTLSHSEVLREVQLDLVDRRRNRERLESEESFFPVPSAAEALDRAHARKLDVAQRLAFEIEKLEL